jgi:hypothetical protein
MVRAACLTALCLALSGCADVTRSLSYTEYHPSTVVLDDGRNFLMQPHPRENTILMRRPLGIGMGQALVKGATFHIANPGDGYDPWRKAAELFVQPLGCQVTDVYKLPGEGGAWEARYTCPAGVDLRAEVAKRRGQSSFH